MILFISYFQTLFTRELYFSFARKKSGYFNVIVGEKLNVE